jgi:hypothetical protein
MLMAGGHRPSFVIAGLTRQSMMTFNESNR